MDETIKIRSIDKSDWSKTLQGFQPDKIRQLYEIYGGGGQVIGVICEAVDDKYYINGKPTIEYASLQSAAGALLKSKREEQ